MPNTINNARFAPSPWTRYTCVDITRLLEVDQEMIKVPPLPKSHSFDGLPDVWVDVRWNDGQGGMRVDRDSPKISVFLSDSFECQGNPINSP